MKTIAWLPAHPAMGWASMNRCWQALERQAQVQPPSDLKFVCPFKPVSVVQPPASRWRRQWSRSVSYPWHVRRMKNCDAVHVLDHSFADLLRWSPTAQKKIVTVHDIFPLLDPMGMTAAQVQRFRRRLECVRLADVVLCVSEFTKQGLIHLVGVEPEKLRVLPNGVDLPATSPMPLELDLPRPWLLLVGSNLPRKNLRLLPEVLTHLSAHGLQPSVLRVGPPLLPDLHSLITAVIGDDHLFELGQATDATLSSAYASADALFFPSTLEGFGLPMLEAMAHGCPVVCARSSSLPEVAGDAALFFDPHDAADAARKCALALTDAHTRDRLRSQGLARAQQFTWTRHFYQLCDVYREVLA